MKREERGPYRRSSKPRATEGELVTVRTYGDVLSAETDRASLEGAGIVGHVIEGASFNPVLASAIGAIRLQVASGDVEDALEVLGVASLEEAEADDENEGAIRCPRCELAYCNFERPRLRNAEASVAFLLLPITHFFGEKRWRCEKCMHAWDDPEEGPKAITKLEEGDPRPVFRLRRSRAGLGVFLGLGAGLIAAIALAAKLPLLLAAGGAVIGGFVGRAVQHDVCSVPDCRAPLPPGIDACPRCKGTISGVVESAPDHFAAAADARRALAALHADEAKRALDRASKTKKKKAKSSTASSARVSPREAG